MCLANEPRNEKLKPIPLAVLYCTQPAYEMKLLKPIYNTNAALNLKENRRGAEVLDKVDERPDGINVYVKERILGLPRYHRDHALFLSFSDL